MSESICQNLTHHRSYRVCRTGTAILKAEIFSPRSERRSVAPKKTPSTGFICRSLAGSDRGQIQRLFQLPAAAKAPGICSTKENMVMGCWIAMDSPNSPILRGGMDSGAGDPTQNANLSVQWQAAAERLERSPFDMLAPGIIYETAALL